MDKYHFIYDFIFTFAEKMKYSLIYLCLLFSLSITAQTINWAQSLTSFGPDNGKCLVFDNAGFIYSGVQVYGNPQVNGTAIDGSALIKYNKAGTIIWALNIPGIIVDVAVDSNGDVFICGQFENTVQFGDSIFTSLGQNDIFISKISSSGNFIWSKKVGGMQNDEVAALCTTSNTVNVVAFMGSMAYVNNTVVNNLGGSSMIIQYATNGDFVWAQQQGYNNRPFDIECDNGGNILICGYYSFGSDFGGSTTVAGDGGFVSKYTSAGIFSWVYTIPDNQWNIVNSLSTDNVGNIYACGYFKDTADFGISSLVALSFKDIFALKLNSSGIAQWAKQTGYYDEDFGFCGVLDGDNFNIAGAWGMDYPTSLALFVKSYNTFNGNETMFWKRDSLSVNEIHAITADDEGKLYFSGLFTDSLKIKTGLTLLSYGTTDKDYFIASMTPDYAPVSVNEPEINISLYPNPVQNVLHVESVPGEAVFLNIYSMTGNPVFKKTFCGSTEFSTSEWADGIYLLTLKGLSTTGSRLLIIQH